MSALVVLLVVFGAAVVGLWTAAILKWRKKRTRLYESMSQIIEKELQEQAADGDASATCACQPRCIFAPGLLRAVQGPIAVNFTCKNHGNSIGSRVLILYHVPIRKDISNLRGGNYMKMRNILALLLAMWSTPAMRPLLVLPEPQSMPTWPTLTRNIPHAMAALSQSPSMDTYKLNTEEFVAMELYPLDRHEGYIPCFAGDVLENNMPNGRAAPRIAYLDRINVIANTDNNAALMQLLADECSYFVLGKSAGDRFVQAPGLNPNYTGYSCYYSVYWDDPGAYMD